MKTWNFGIIGAGLIADFHARALGDLANARLVGVTDTNPAKAGKLAEKYSCRAFADVAQMLHDPQIEVVTIATPSGAHLAPAVAAAEAGRHVLCEKPLEVTLERVSAMIQAHERAGTCLGGIFQTRFQEALVPLREAIRDGRFGRISFAGAFVPWWRPDSYYRDNWHGTWDLDGGGALINQSIHTIDLLCDLMGPVESVQAYADHRVHRIEAEDTAVAALRFANGALGLIHGTTASWPGRASRLEITGEKGTVVYTQDCLAVWQFAEDTPQDEQIRRNYGTPRDAGGAADPAAISYEGHRKNFAAFLDALATGSHFAISGAEARRSIELILAIYQSARQQKRVQLTDI
ncbi:MAG: Gfo/Idh/MocA family oxidoreductase [Sedimentisphaerales bacterium]|nr:Gfo/Idh/MocA family oxidoreductase [Sedimentisphaerales bacterium]